MFQSFESLRYIGPLIIHRQKFLNSDSFLLSKSSLSHIISRFRQLEEEKRATNRVDMRFVALYSILEMLYGNPSLNNFF